MYRWRARMPGKKLLKKGNPLEKGDEHFPRKRKLGRELRRTL